MENGSDGQIEEPFIFVDRLLTPIAEEGMAPLLQVVEKALPFIIDPFPDI
jgi:hypothetical protein